MKQPQLLQQRCAQPPDGRALLLAWPPQASRRPGPQRLRAPHHGGRAPGRWLHPRRAGMGGGPAGALDPPCDWGSGQAAGEGGGGLGLDRCGLLLPHACMRRPRRHPSARATLGLLAALHRDLAASELGAA
jgi:hypothetical protein